jgi:hypothetical protein
MVFYGVWQASPTNLEGLQVDDIPSSVMEEVATESI